MPELEPYPTYPEHQIADDIAHLKTHENEWKGRLFQKLRKPIAAAAIIGSLYFQDVQSGHERLANTHPEIISIYDAGDNAPQDTGVYLLGGLGQKDAIDAAKSLPVYRQAGEVNAVSYDNSGLDSAVIANMIREDAEEDGIRRIILDGKSMGGLVALEVAANIQASDDDLSIKAIVLDCTPDEFDSVQPDEQEKAEWLQRVGSFIPGSEYSSTLRFASEMGARKKQFFDWNEGIDVEKAYEASREILDEKLLSERAASSVLIYDQLNKILNSPAWSAMESLAGDNHGKLPPTIIYMRPDDPRRDHTVNVARAEANFRNIARGNGLVFFTRFAYATEHANPAQRPSEYTNAIIGIMPWLTKPDQSSQTITLALPHPSNK